MSIKTKVLSLENDSEQVCLLEAKRVLDAGGLVVFPTETVYGIGARTDISSAVEFIFEAKRRPRDNPLICHVGSIEDMHRMADFSYDLDACLTSCMPGPATCIFPFSGVCDDMFTAGTGKVAVRIPQHEFARKMVSLCPFGVVAPSANLSTRPSGTKVEHVIEDFMGVVPLIIDGGESVLGLESTVFSLFPEPRIHRLGMYTADDLSSFFNLSFAFEVADESPGHKYRHYAPKAPLLLVLENEMIQASKDDVYIRCALIPRVRGAREILWGDESDQLELASQLYDCLRQSDSLRVTRVYIDAITNQGLGEAIMQRVKMAQKK